MQVNVNSVPLGLMGDRGAAGPGAGLTPGRLGGALDGRIKKLVSGAIYPDYQQPARVADPAEDPPTRLVDSCTRGRYTGGRSPKAIRRR
jgi:hypothetical protein